MASFRLTDILTALDIDVFELTILYSRIVLGGSAIIYLLLQSSKENSRQRISLGDFLKFIAIAHVFGLVGVLAGFSANSLWAPLAKWTFAATAAVLNLLFNDVIADPQTLILGTNRFNVEVTESCSGIEGIGLISAFLAVYLYNFRAKLVWPRAFITIPIGWALSLSLNILRLVLLICVGDKISPQIALDGFHSQSGWLAFTALALGFTLLIDHSSFFLKAPDRNNRKAIETQANPATPYLLPLIVVVASNIGTALFLSQFDYLNPIHYILGALTIIIQAQKVRPLKFKFSLESILMGITIAVLWIVFSTPDLAKDHEYSKQLTQLNIPSLIWISTKIFGYILVSPIAEELAFRGFLVRRLENTDFSSISLKSTRPKAWIISSILFGVFHQQWILATIAGLGFCWIAKFKNNVWDAIHAHVTANFIIAMYALYSSHWSILT